MTGYKNTKYLPIGYIIYEESILNICEVNLTIIQWYL